ncbi:uncharacterized protein LOC107366793 [Tetranychus urticae]|uniref:Uncharacterized protein n=1 Tax=Tetranychus urticae TaxID=32264 RepID=T1KRV1_TETUR|nr:uncharacterized protein LOC107366793 [Tetranychus urticae]
MTDSTIDETYVPGGFSTESGYSLGEECDLEHDQWLQNYLTTIDKIVLLGKAPAKGLSEPVINECYQWRDKFRQKFSESERGSIFLKYSNQTDSNWTNFETRSATSKSSIESFKWDPSRLISRFSRQQYDLSSSTTSKSSSDTSQITLSSRGSISEENGGKGLGASRAVILEPLKSHNKSVPSTIDDVGPSIKKPKPIQLPPINGKPSKISKRLGSINASNNQVIHKKGFPSPPVFFSINDIFAHKTNTDDYMSKSENIFEHKNQAKSKGFFRNYQKAEKYQANGSSS